MGGGRRCLIWSIFHLACSCFIISATVLSTTAQVLSSLHINCVMFATLAPVQTIISLRADWNRGQVKTTCSAVSTNWSQVGHSGDSAWPTLWKYSLKQPWPDKNCQGKVQLAMFPVHPCEDAGYKTMGPSTLLRGIPFWLPSFHRTVTVAKGFGHEPLLRLTSDHLMRHWLQRAVARPWRLKSLRTSL